MSTFPTDIKLIVIDIDGTLLNPQRHITPRTRESIKAAQEAGIVVTLATGRRYINTAPIAAELGMDIPIILCDGALIIQHPDGSVMHSHHLDAEVAQQVIEILIKYKIQPIVHRININIEEVWTGPSEFDNEWVSEYFALFPNNLYRAEYTSFCIGRPDPLRVVAFSSEEIIYGLIPEISALHCSWNIIHYGNYHTSEMAIMHKACSKASGVLSLAKSLKIEPQQIMAIGDNNNDIEMLRAAGWGVAMGQATDAVKAAAQAVTASNEEDGAAQAIERYALRLEPKASSNSIKRATCL